MSTDGIGQGARRDEGAGSPEQPLQGVHRFDAGHNSPGMGNPQVDEAGVLDAAAQQHKPVNPRLFALVALLVILVVIIVLLILF